MFMRCRSQLLVNGFIGKQFLFLDFILYFSRNIWHKECQNSRYSEDHMLYNKCLLSHTLHHGMYHYYIYYFTTLLFVRNMEYPLHGFTDVNNSVPLTNTNDNHYQQLKIMTRGYTTQHNEHVYIYILEAHEFQITTLQLLL